MPTILVAVAGALGAVVRYRIGLALAVALAAVPGAIECFVGLAYSRQRREVLSIDGAKTDETRQRRIVKTVDAMRG